MNGLVSQHEYKQIPFTLMRKGSTRYVRLRITPHQGLVITAPKGCRLDKIEEIIIDKHNWISRHQSLIDVAKQAQRAQNRPQLPETLDLPAIGEEWVVEYRPTTLSMVRVKEDAKSGTLIVYGAVKDKKRCMQALHQWLRMKAQVNLPLMLAEVAEKTGLSYRGISIRNQTARWGSCSSRRIISLNQKLLFLPEKLAHYVLVHELCHTRHMNHSAAYWAEVAKHLPTYRKLDNALQNAWQEFIPSWAYAKPAANDA